MTKWFCWAAVGLSLLGCGPDTSSSSQSEVYSPCENVGIALSEATPEQTLSVRQGLRLWNEMGFTRLHQEPSAQVVPVLFKEAPPFFYGRYDGETGEVTINSQLAGQKETAVTLAHELGHAMGLPHVDKSLRASVMNPGNTEIPPTLEDNAALMALWNNCHP